jgi:hypothetical protein
MLGPRQQVLSASRNCLRVPQINGEVTTNLVSSSGTVHIGFIKKFITFHQMFHISIAYFTQRYFLSSSPYCTQSLATTGMHDMSELEFPSIVTSTSTSDQKNHFRSTAI